MSYFATTFLWILPFTTLAYFGVFGVIGFLMFRRLQPSDQPLMQQVCEFGEGVAKNIKHSFKRDVDTLIFCAILIGSILAVTFICADTHTKNHNHPTAEWCNGENTVVNTNRLTMCLPNSSMDELTAIQSEQEQLNKRLKVVKALTINRETLEKTK